MVTTAAVSLQVYSVLFCVLLPLFSVGFHAVMSVPAFHGRNASSSDPMREAFATQFRLTDLFWLSELCVIGVICVEMLLRLLCWPSKLRFFADPLNWADILGSLLPLLRWLVLFLPLDSLAHPRLLYTCSAFVSFRLFRILRLWRCFATYRRLMLAVRYSLPDLFLSLFLTLLLVVSFSFIFFAVEHGVGLPITSCIWLSVISLTTVGYGDVHPKTFFGKVAGGVCLLTAILVVVLPVASLSNNFLRANRNLRLAEVLRKAMPQPPPKDLELVPQVPGTPMYPVLPPESDSTPIVQGSA